VIHTAAPAEAYPLYWPEGRARTLSRQSSAFKTSGLARVRDELLNELKLLRARLIVISTNIPIRRDGLPYAGQAQPKDPGVAVYFTRNDKQLCFACDRWRKVEDNIWAVAKTIDALRGVARWGTGDMIEAAFTGFAALPAAKPWHEILGCEAMATNDEIEEAYRREVMRRHPDKGGSVEAFGELMAAMEQVRGRLTER
jgi:hypothetical protein